MFHAFCFLYLLFGFYLILEKRLLCFYKQFLHIDIKLRPNAYYRYHLS